MLKMHHLSLSNTQYLDGIHLVKQSLKGYRCQIDDVDKYACRGCSKCVAGNIRELLPLLSHGLNSKFFNAHEGISV